MLMDDNFSGLNTDVIRKLIKGYRGDNPSWLEPLKYELKVRERKDKLNKIKSNVCTNR